MGAYQVGALDLYSRLWEKSSWLQTVPKDEMLADLAGYLGDPFKQQLLDIRKEIQTAIFQLRKDLITTMEINCILTEVGLWMKKIQAVEFNLEHFHDYPNDSIAEDALRKSFNEAKLDEVILEIHARCTTNKTMAPMRLLVDAIANCCGADWKRSNNLNPVARTNVLQQNGE
ncbi:hypothetical protein BV898_19324 [Hypsibius exemplaris]|uniref:Uncharacterized protein n=1 Tax=Hypsibius exemplaris TaxID=2072580 RepID=A0A9X6RPC8_HYPEX|nr:hypothetical protein BV898_19324 [Hypsibius exemplaris]